MYMMIPETLICMRRFGFSCLNQAWVMGSYIIGLYVFGPFVNYLVERYRRKRVCQFAMLLLISDMAIMLYMLTTTLVGRVEIMVFLRFFLGATYGLTKMVLLSTLAIDMVESFHRTEANYHIGWFGRFAVALGPFVSLWIISRASLEQAFLLSMIMIVLAFLFISLTNIRFKTPPDNINKCSFDRFFLLAGIRLFVCLSLVLVSVGLLYTLRLPMTFYAWMAFGFFIAIVAERVVFSNAELKSQAVVANFAIILAFLLLLTRPAYQEALVASAILLGFGIGLVGSRFLLFFIKLSSHCQRGTSQSSFFLAWETGIGIGLFFGILVFCESMSSTLYCALAVIVTTCIMYVVFLHRWYMEHKNR